MLQLEGEYQRHICTSMPYLHIYLHIPYITYCPVIKNLCLGIIFPLAIVYALFLDCDFISL